MEGNDSIGERMKEIRIEKGLTQRQIADSIGVTYQHISQYERGLRTPKMNTIRKIAEALGVDVWEIIGFNDIDYEPMPASPTEAEANPEEAELITIYHGLNDRGKAVLMGTARGLENNSEMKGR